MPGSEYTAPVTTLGDVVRKSGVIPAERLDFALKEQKRTGFRLGQILVDHGIVDEAALYNAVAETTGERRLDMNTVQVDLDATRRIDPEWALENRMMPLRFEQRRKTLTVAVTDPTQSTLLDELSVRFAAQPTVLIATESEIGRLIRHAYFGEQLDRTSGGSTIPPAITRNADDRSAASRGRSLPPFPTGLGAPKAAPNPSSEPSGIAPKGLAYPNPTPSAAMPEHPALTRGQTLFDDPAPLREGRELADRLPTVAAPRPLMPAHLDPSESKTDAPRESLSTRREAEDDADHAAGRGKTVIDPYLSGYPRRPNVPSLASEESLEQPSAIAKDTAAKPASSATTAPPELAANERSIDAASSLFAAPHDPDASGEAEPIPLEDVVESADLSSEVVDAEQIFGELNEELSDSLFAPRSPSQPPAPPPLPKSDPVFLGPDPYPPAAPPPNGPFSELRAPGPFSSFQRASDLQHQADADLATHVFSDSSGHRAPNTGGPDVGLTGVTVPSLPATPASPPMAPSAWRPTEPSMPGPSLPAPSADGLVDDGLVITGPQGGPARSIPIEPRPELRSAASAAPPGHALDSLASAGASPEVPTSLQALSPVFEMHQHTATALEALFEACVARGIITREEYLARLGSIDLSNEPT